MTHEKGQTGPVGSMDGSADFVQENRDKLCALAAALKHLVEVIEAHEIESLSCDRDGNEYCDCLQNAATEAKRLLPNLDDEPRRGGAGSNAT